MYERILKNLSRHIHLSPGEQELFTSCLKRRRLRRKQFLLQSGDISRYECFVDEGCLRTYGIDKKGQEHTFMFACEDWWTGDMYSYLTGQPSQFDIEALEDSSLLLLNKQQMDKLYEQIPQLNKFFRILLQNAYISMQRRINENLMLSAEERYNTFLTRYPQLENRIPLKHIASYVGITPESLSRIRNHRK